MASQHVSKIFIIGGTGVQGVPIVKALVNDKKYQVRVLTRDTLSRHANELLALGNVELLQGTLDSEHTLRDGFKGCDGAFFNIDGFHTGEKAEIMGASLFTVAPYIDIAIGAQIVITLTIEDGTLTWRVPLGKSYMPLGYLGDCGHYHISFKDLATIFESVTGHQAHMQQNFTGFWNAFKHELVFKIDYTLLDEIHPNRVKSAEDWFRQQDKILQSSGKGGLCDRVQPENIWPVLKRGEDEAKK
ncbi:hypothetical protein V8C34DRAFT_327494 [Trichoderma compactum]